MPRNFVTYLTLLSGCKLTGAFAAVVTALKYRIVAATTSEITLIIAALIT